MSMEKDFDRLAKGGGDWLEDLIRGKCETAGLSNIYRTEGWSPETGTVGTVAFIDIIVPQLASAIRKEMEKRMPRNYKLHSFTGSKIDEVEVEKEAVINQVPIDQARWYNQALSDVRLAFGLEEK